MGTNYIHFNVKLTTATARSIHGASHKLWCSTSKMGEFNLMESPVHHGGWSVGCGGLVEVHCWVSKKFRNDWEMCSCSFSTETLLPFVESSVSRFR